MTEAEESEVKEAIVGSVAYANSGEPMRFGDVVRATMLLDEGTEVVGELVEVELWFNSMEAGHVVAVRVDDGDEFLYCDPDGMELVRSAGCEVVDCGEW